MGQIYLTYLDHLGIYQDRFRQIREALPEGVEAVVYTRNAAGATSDGMMRIVEFPKRLAYRSVLLQWQLFKEVRMNARRSEVVVQDWFKNFALSLLLRKPLRMRFKHIFSPVTSDFGWFYKRWHGIIPFLGHRYDWLRARECLQDWWMCRACDILLVQSEDLMVFYRRAYGLAGKTMDFNYNAHFPEKEAQRVPKPPGAPVEIGYVGNFEMHKGGKDLLEMAKSLPEGFRLRIAGRAKGKENIRLMDETLALPNVKAEGFLSKASLAEFFREIDALVLFSYHEGSPRVVMEFLPYHKPIFMYDNPGTDYCRGMEGIFCFAYGQIDTALEELKRTDFGRSYARSIPDRLRQNRLGGLLAEAFSND